nr:LacI family DNA-binding transcriptional regulator [Micromonospora sp. DSM 115978]
MKNQPRNGAAAGGDAPARTGHGHRGTTPTVPEQAPTLRDVGQLAGVHATTASRALNPQMRPLVNPETVRKVLRAAESLGYQPNPIARSLKTARSSTIGLVIPDLTNPLFPPIVRGIEDVLGPAGYNAWIVNTDNDPERETALVESLRSRQVEGLIVATARRQHPLLERLHRQGMRMVLVNRKVDGVEIPTVSADDSGGIAMAVRHLVELGHERIAHLAGPANTSTGVVRANAFRHAVRDHGLEYDPSLVVHCDYWTENPGAQSLRGLLDAGRSFTAVVAGNDLIALGCYDVFVEREIACPAEMSVVGFNDMPFLDKMRPALTTVRVPHYEVGAEAARMLLDTIDGPDRRSRSVLLSTSLVVRQSTSHPPRPA